ncbi:MAG: hypothetical protein IJ301_03725 [Clostridia bacterium]|nr:hypothetical protein [Clostridia bacterium]
MLIYIIILLALLCLVDFVRLGIGFIAFVLTVDEEEECQLFTQNTVRFCICALKVVGLILAIMLL